MKAKSGFWNKYMVPIITGLVVTVVAGFILAHYKQQPLAPNIQSQGAGDKNIVVQANQGTVNIGNSTPESSTKTQPLPDESGVSTEQQEHSKPKPVRQPLKPKPHTAPSGFQLCPNGICIGGNNSGIATVNNNPPVNPNAMTVVYDCSGNRRSIGPTPNTGLSVNVEVGGGQSTLQKMSELNNSHQYSELLNTCRASMITDPEWLTPYLFCGLGYLGKRDTLNAKEMLAHYEQYKGPAYNVEMCNDIEYFLRSRLEGF